MLEFTTNQWAVLFLVLVMGWLLGLLSSAGGDRWRRQYEAEHDARLDAERDRDAHLAAQRERDERVDIERTRENRLAAERYRDEQMRPMDVPPRPSRF